MAHITINQYLFERLKQLGVESVFGVPGDYELVMLDDIPKAGLAFKGNPNELNASYAADGYSRIKGVGAMVTTFGPGDLSTFCGVAGAYAEYVPIASIVGYPPVTAMNKHAIMHHSLGNGQFGMFHEMVKPITVATAVITTADSAVEEIDRVLTAMMHYSRPVSIGVPVDIGVQPISSESLSKPLKITLDANESTLESTVVPKILKEVLDAKNLVVIVDGVAIRCGCQNETVALIQALGAPYFVTSMSKGFDESLPKFGGVYSGLASVKPLRDAVEASDCVLWIGSYRSDFNTGEFTEKVREEAIIDFQRHFVSVNGERYALNMPQTLKALTGAITKSGCKVNSQRVDWNQYPFDDLPKPEKMSQDYLWTSLGRYLRSNDLVIAETGTSAYGVAYSSLMGKAGVHMYSQTVFGSIGFATGAAVGSFIARSELKHPGRSILVTGEGSLQLTVQAFSDLLRHQLGATVFLLNNDGYTVERLIHGVDAPYNTVPIWSYSQLGALFGPTAQQANRFRHYFISKTEELDALLSDKFFTEEGPRTGVTQVVEIVLGRLDAPKGVIEAAAAVGQFNEAQKS